MKKGLLKEPLLYVAMDFKERGDMRRGAEQISRVKGNWGFKINDDYIGKYSPAVAAADVKSYNKSIFFDMKLLKGRRRMVNIVEELNAIGGIDFTNIFAVAGNDLEKVIEATQRGETKILALTLLTHLGNDECKRIYRRSFQRQVRVLTEIAYDANCAGALIPGTCLEALEHINIIKAVTAIRPDWYVSKKANPQKQAVTHKYAVRNGANIVIAGSPIWDSPNPVDSMQRILDEIHETWVKMP